jgi:DNA (cytosine-5)-methyltransferase 1
VLVSWKEIIREIVSLGYKLYWKVISTREHGIPQSRPRVYIVAIRSDSLLSEMKWPDEEPMKPIELFLKKDSERKQKDDLGTTAKAVLKKALSQIRAAGGHPKKEFWLIDVSASE